MLCSLHYSLANKAEDAKSYLLHADLLDWDESRELPAVQGHNNKVCGCVCGCVAVCVAVWLCVWLCGCVAVWLCGCGICGRGCACILFTHPLGGAHSCCSQQKHLPSGWSVC